MADGPSLETFSSHGSALNGASAPQNAPEATDSGSGNSILAILGLLLAVAGIAFAIYRIASGRRKADPTTERIQQLIDEANRLLKQLDEKQPG